jgi:regulator of sirC expression with transglutaminase-like and TPR domain
MPRDQEDPREYLKRLGESGDGPHDIAHAALMLSALDHPDLPLQSYLAHLEEIAELARSETKFLSDADACAQAVVAILSQRLKYDGDRTSYEDPQNADLIRVIDRRRGLPVALGILYIHAARAAGCAAEGLNTPAHFLLRIERGGQHALIDPFSGGIVRERDSLEGPPRALAAAPDDIPVFEPVSDTDVLLRLQNNLKLRAIEAKDGSRSLELAQRMAFMAPQRAEVWLDFARLSEAAGVLGAARAAYEACLEIATQGNSLHNEVALALYSLKRRLN